ncbi:MAG: hypothetical protein R3A13_01975 [Bdellovibrionota bacterium]
MNFIKKIQLCLFLIILITPFLLGLFSVSAGLKLGGETKQEKEIRLAVDTLRSGAYQRRFEKRFMRRLAIWPYLVKTDNQINFSIFRQISTNYRANVILGKDNNLIEKAYLRSLSKVAVPKLKRLEERISKMRELQDRLSAHGVAFLFLISPNKPSLYPEYVPKQYQIAGAETREGAYQKMLPLLDKYGINYLDGQAFFAAKKAAAKYPFFAHSGTHWNEYAACLISRELRNRISELVAKPMRDFSCEPVVMRKVPVEADRDLVNLINIWTPELTYRKSPRPIHKTIPAESQARINMLFVGTSFTWPVLRYLDYHRIYNKRNFYYYFKRNESFPKLSSQAINKNQLNWKKAVLSRDAVIIEVNEAFVQKAGYGFINEALKQIPAGFPAKE